MSLCKQGIRGCEQTNQCWTIYHRHLTCIDTVRAVVVPCIWYWDPFCCWRFVRIVMNRIFILSRVPALQFRLDPVCKCPPLAHTFVPSVFNASTHLNIIRWVPGMRLPFAHTFIAQPDVPGKHTSGIYFQKHFDHHKQIILIWFPTNL